MRNLIEVEPSIPINWLDYTDIGEFATILSSDPEAYTEVRNYPNEYTLTII